MRSVPALELAPGQTLFESMAIVEYLDETHPEPPLLPKDPLARARVRALAQLVACDIHPLNNLRVLRYLARELKEDDAARDRWYAHWIHEGFRGLETALPQSGSFCHGIKQPYRSRAILAASASVLAVVAIIHQSPEGPPSITCMLPTVSTLLIRPSAALARSRVSLARSAPASIPRSLKKYR